MSNKSLVNAAYDVLTQKFANEKKSNPMPFGELLVAVGEEIGITDENELIKICSRFYTDLTLDGRFVIKENNTWVLREHEKYADVHIDMNEVYDEEIEDEDSSSERNEDEENDEFDDEPKKRNDDEEEELGEETDTPVSLSEDDFDENN